MVTGEQTGWARPWVGPRRRHRGANKAGRYAGRLDKEPTCGAGGETAYNRYPSVADRRDWLSDGQLVSSLSQ